MSTKYFFVVLILLVSIIKNEAIVESAISTVDIIYSEALISLSDERKLIKIEDFYELSGMISNKVNKLNSEVLKVNTYSIDYLLLKQYEKIFEYTDRVDFLYKDSQKWTKNLKKNIKILAIDQKTTKMISYDCGYPISLLFDLQKLFFQINKGNSSNFIDNLQKLLQSSNNTFCEIELTPHYQLFAFYTQIIYAEVQGFASVVISFIWRYKNYGFNYTHEMNDVKENRINNIIEYTKLFKNKMSITKNFIRSCDAKNEKNSKIIGKQNYASFNNLFYTILLNSEDLNSHDTIGIDKKWNTFRLCQLHDNCNDDNDNDNICPGWIKECKKTLMTDYIQKNKNDHSSTKNYFRIKVFYNDKNTEYGCTNPYQTAGRLGLQNMWEKRFLSVVCNCVNDGIHTKSDTIRAFSLLWSQTSNDMVATGARLVGKDRMIHIQLREGKLLPHGRIDKNTERWIPLPKFEYNNNFPNKAIYSNGTEHLLKENIDFVSLHDLYAKEICLQKLTFDEEHLLSGVRFSYEYVGEGLERRFKLEAKYVGFNYQNGNITTGKKYKNQSCARLTELVLNNPDDPLKFETHPHDSKENQFITIRSTDLIKDASQTTIPFFDISEVTSNPSLPISGLELFHKGQVDGTSGGYISLKIYPLNLTMYMNCQSFVRI